MDKLQPLIKHHYWICFVLAVIFVLVGWWTASGAIAVATEERKKSVEDSFSKSTQNDKDPNQSWVDEAAKKNALEDADYKVASKELWNRQKSARQWPPLLAAEMKDIPFEGEIKNTTTRDKWASIYKDEIERLLEIVKPYKNGEGLVDVNSSRITHKPFNSWRYGKPTSPEIWDNQEDIWLLRSLLTAIARVNDGATRISESQVRKIFALKLRGGDREAKPGGGGGAGGGAMGEMMSGMMGSMMESPGSGEGMGMGMGMGMGGGAANHPGTSFEGKAGNDILDEEFGPSGDGAGGMGGMGGMGGKMSASSMGEAMYSEGESGGAGAAEVKRYVDGGPGVELGYKTRGFVLEVLVRDDQLPNLLASLTNSDFPVEIVRVEINSNSGGGSPGGAGEAMSGMSGGSMGMGSMGMGSMGMGSMGMGGGMEGDDMGGGFSGQGDLGGLSGGEGMSSSMSGAMTKGLGIPGGAGDINTSAAAKGKIAYQTAMSDPLIVHVKIGGLMTLYQSKEEFEAQAAAEAAAATTEKAVAPPEGSAVESTDTPPADPAMTDAALPAVEGGETTDTGTNNASTDAATASPGAAPSETSPSASDPAAVETAAPPASEPANGDPAAPASTESVPAGDGTSSPIPDPASGVDPK